MGVKRRALCLRAGRLRAIDIVDEDNATGPLRKIVERLGQLSDLLDDLRQLIARADALVSAAEGLFNNPFAVTDREDR